ncbi:MAG TPA: hypothetical protein VGO68_03355 [Pyrinomonadaceae bacterium]|jgi:hypothetical protein|nr:hypothetical protein [Pyrinomonadaceae bacterium]
MANDYFFFTDINQQASNATDYIKVQTPGGAYGPIPPAPVGHTTDEYRVTSLHTASYNPTAYSACDGIVCVQRIPATITGTGPPLVNVILKPLVQPALNFAPVKYIIYKGILADSLIAPNGTDVAATGNNRLTKFLWDEQATRNASASAPANALGINLTGTNLADTDPIDNLFFRFGVAFQLPPVEGGWSIGQFNKDEFGIEVLMEGLAFSHTLKLARQLENRISVQTLPTGANDALTFDHWHAKEQILGFMDPCAFYGSFFPIGVQARISTTPQFVSKPQKLLFQDVLFLFDNRNKAYLDIRNEHNFSFNYFKNYGPSIKLGNTAVDYYGSKWPIMTVTAANFPNNTTKARNTFQIQMPQGDNDKPLVYISQGYRDINSKGNGFPPELKGAERFYDKFNTAVGGYTATPNNVRNMGLTSMSFVVPNVTGAGFTSTTPVSCYIRLKYLKQQPGTPAVSTAIEPANYLDNLIYPLDLRILFAGVADIKTAVYDEETYVNAQTVPGLKFDFIGKVGIARDSNNTTMYLVPSIVRKNPARTSALVQLPAETSDGPDSYLTLIASRYPTERVRQGDLQITATDTIPIAELVSDDAAGGFSVPDFSKLILIVVSNNTFDYWRNNASQGLDNRFRIYLGVKNLQTLTDLNGVAYMSFQLVLRGYKHDPATLSYKVTEVSTDPGSPGNDVKVYAHVEPKVLEITSLTLLDIGGTPLQYLSATPHTYFGGNTRIHGIVTVEGNSQDQLQSLVLEVIQNGAVVATGTLAPTPAATLIAPFGATERVRIVQQQLLFNISSVELAGINATANGTLQLRVRACSAKGQEATRDAQAVQILARYTGNNRYGPRDVADGGDDWIRPSVLALLNQIPNVEFGDMCNMNGGTFPPHTSHNIGVDVDVKYPGYSARDAACAQTMINHLNAAVYGSRITIVYVTYTRTPANVFYQAIKDVTLNDGRRADAVIQPRIDHGTHCHWRFSP